MQRSFQHFSEDYQRGHVSVEGRRLAFPQPRDKCKPNEYPTFTDAFQITIAYISIHLLNFLNAMARFLIYKRIQKALINIGF